MWIIALKSASVALPLLLPIRAAFPSYDACAAAVALMPNSQAFARAHKAEIACVEYRIVGERRL